MSAGGGGEPGLDVAVVVVADSGGMSGDLGEKILLFAGFVHAFLVVESGLVGAAVLCDTRGGGGELESILVAA